MKAVLASAAAAFAVAAPTLVLAADSVSASVTVPVTVTVRGTGIVDVGRYEVSCGIYVGRPCSARIALAKGSIAAFGASGARGSRFSRWKGACTGSLTICRIVVRRATSVTATFDSLGAVTNPVPIGTAAEIGPSAEGLGWTLKVVAVTPDATAAVLAIGNNARNYQPRPGAQDFLVVVAATAHGSDLDLSPLIVNLYAKTRNSYSTSSVYRNGNCGTLPPPHLTDGATLGSDDWVVADGHTVTGTICFQVDSDDAKTLRLFSEPPLLYPNGMPDPVAPDAHARWFALR